MESLGTHGGPAKVWLIGASAGIGRALAHEYARRGTNLILSARDATALHELQSALPNDARVLPLDITDREALDRAMAEVGPVDAILVLAAAYEPGPFDRISPESARRIVDANILGGFHAAQIAPRALRKGGQLVLFGSVAGYFGLPGGQLYSATKAAIANMAESLRVEYAPDVRVRLVSPGFVQTRLTDKNDFEMPALLSPEEAARAIVAGLAGNQFEVHFPKRFTWKMKLLRALPYPLAFRLTSRLS